MIHRTSIVIKLPPQPLTDFINTCDLSRKIIHLDAFHFLHIILDLRVRWIQHRRSYAIFPTSEKCLQCRQIKQDLWDLSGFLLQILCDHRRGGKYRQKSLIKRRVSPFIPFASQPWIAFTSTSSPFSQRAAVNTCFDFIPGLIGFEVAEHECQMYTVRKQE